MNASLIDVDAIVWRSFKPYHHDGDDALLATDHVSNWLGDFGMDVLQGRPDHWAQIDANGEVFAYRYESHGNPARHRAVCVIVTLDRDADGTPGEGWRDRTTCVGVEIVRCKSEQQERADVAADGRA